jgi:predicted XRE-type DNA-binding protein
MHAQEMSQADIAKVLGLTQPQISHDLKEIYKRWRTSDRDLILAQRERMLYLSVEANATQDLLVAGRQHHRR